MMTNAQLDNEKSTLIYEVETLKDTLEDRDEQMMEYQREAKEKHRVSRHLILVKSPIMRLNVNKLQETKSSLSLLMGIAYNHTFPLMYFLSEIVADLQSLNELQKSMKTIRTTLCLYTSFFGLKFK